MKTSLAVVASVLMIGVLGGGCGVPKEQHQKTLDALKTCEDEFAAEKTARADADSKVKTLEGELASAKSAGDALGANAEGLQKDLKSTREELEELRRQRAETEKRLQAFRDLTAKFQKMIDTGKLKVRIRGGRMILELPAGILFASGKADLSKEGTTALTEVAIILKDFGDRKFLVAGHTDNQPLRGSKYKNNWQLATARALTVTEFLVTAGMAGQNLAAAGYAEFDPVGDNATEDGRQLNRRIEIVLVPNISELPGLPEDLTKS